MDEKTSKTIKLMAEAMEKVIKSVTLLAEMFKDHLREDHGKDI